MLPSLPFLIAAGAALAGTIGFALLAEHYRGIAALRRCQIDNLSLNYMARGRRIALLEAELAAIGGQRRAALDKAMAANRARHARTSGGPAAGGKAGR